MELREIIWPLPNGARFLDRGTTIMRETHRLGYLCKDCIAEIVVSLGGLNLETGEAELLTNPINFLTCRYCGFTTNDSQEKQIDLCCRPYA
jgi:hypothetical protein